MTTAATSLLGLALPVTGELAGTWGTTVNDGITSLLDTAVAGTTTISTDADVTLTTTSLAANQARQAIILWTANGTATRTITAPAQSKIYTVINASAGTQSIVLRGATPTTGVTIVKGESALCAWNGSDFIKISNTGGAASFTNVTVSGTTTLSGLTASTALALDASKNVVSVTNTGTGNNVLSASPTLTGTVGAAALTLSSDLTLSGGSANGVLYLNGSKVATSGSALTFDGTNLGIGAASFTNAQKLNVNGNALIGGNGSASAVYIGTNGGLPYLQAYDPTAANNQLAFYIGAATEQMRLTSTGLGIGTSSPTQKLTVVGNALVTPSGGWTTGGVATQFFGDIYGSIKYDYNTTNFAINSYGSFSIATNGTSPTTRLTVDSSGNLGLGVTPSAWSGFKAFDIGTVGGLACDNGGTFLTKNAYDSTGSGGWKYKTTATALLYLQQAGGAHAWYNAPSGTAGNAISFTQAMTLDASGNLGVGTTSPSALLDASSGGVTSYASPAARFLRNHGGQSYSNLDGLQVYWNTSNGSGESEIVYGSLSTSYLRFIHNNAGTFTERARIDSSGNLLVGTTTAGFENSNSYFFNIGAGYGANAGVNHVNGTASGTPYYAFGYNGSGIGSITQSGTTAVAYNTSSDYRLKDITGPLTGSGEFIDALKPKVGTWKADGSKFVGFLAHEVQEVSPGTVVGKKDAVDKDGKPIMQAMEYGSAEFIANIIAELQSLRQRLAQAGI